MNAIQMIGSRVLVLLKSHSIQNRRCLSKVSYKLTFITGDERGADTKANVHASLIGDRGELVVPIDNSKVNFRRDSEEVVIFETSSHDIGTVESIRVGHDGEGTGAGWYLEKVLLSIKGSVHDSTITEVCSIRNSADDLCKSEVTDDKTTIVLEFPFYGWLGRSDSGGRDGPLAADISPLPIAKWAENYSVSTDEINKLLEESASHPLTLRTAGYCIPHPDKVTAGSRAVCGKNFGYGGEDAYFSHPLGFLGVADGVYSWRAAGIDSGLYSKTLMKGALERADRAAIDKDPVSSMDLFHAAVEEAVRQNAQGSSTACIFGLVPLSLLSSWSRSAHKIFHSIHLGATIGQCANLGNVI